MKFIKLNLVHTETEVFINQKKITDFHQKKGENKTLISFYGEDNFYFVKETPEEIISLCQKKSKKIPVVGDYLKAKKTVKMRYSEETFISKGELYQIKEIKDNYFYIDSDYQKNHRTSLKKLNNYFKIVR